MNRRITPRHVRLREVARSRVGDIAPAIVSAVLRQIAFLSIPFALQRALDGGVIAGDTGVAVRWGAVVVALGVVQSVLLAGWTHWVNLADVHTCGDLRSTMTAGLAGLDRRALSGFGQGDLVLRATRDVEVIGAWVHGLPALAVIATTFVYVLPQLFLLDLTLLLIALAMMPVVAGITLYHRPRFASASAGLSSAHGTRADAVEDLLAAGAAARGLGGETALVRRHHERSGALTLATMTAARTSAAWQSQGASVPRVAIAIGLLAGTQAVLAGRLTVGGLVAFASWMLALEMATRVLVERLSDRGRALVAARRINEVLQGPAGPLESATPTPLPAAGALSAHGVVTAPGARPIDLDAPPGSLVALTGPTGAGKSTLLNLLARTTDPAAGTVSFGGVPLREAALDDVAARIMLVAQRPRLLSGTLRECLLGGGAVDAGDADLHAACRVAVLDEVVRHMPQSLDTLVGERGTTLSGGQVQRLAVARAIVRAPAVLLLDDVTSALDAATEAEFLRRLRLWAGHSRVVVAATHRPGVIEAADAVVHLPARRTHQKEAPACA